MNKYLLLLVAASLLVVGCQPSADNAKSAADCMGHGVVAADRYKARLQGRYGDTADEYVPESPIRKRPPLA